VGLKPFRNAVFEFVERDRADERIQILHVEARKPCSSGSASFAVRNVSDFPVFKRCEDNQRRAATMLEVRNARSRNDLQCPRK
jgi:hypothetical protein